MSKAKSQSAQQNGPNSPPTQAPSASSEDSKLEQRIAKLEKAIETTNDRIWDSHKWFATIFFATVVISLSVLGVLSKIDLGNSLERMEKQTKDSISEMERKFQMLAGEALKHPKIELLIDQKPLNGAELKIELKPGNEITINSVFLKNNGNKRTSPISVQCYFEQIQFADYNARPWRRVLSEDSQFPVAFELQLDAKAIDPMEVWNLTHLDLLYLTGDPEKPFSCRIKVFYGGENPAEATFRIVPKRAGQ